MKQIFWRRGLIVLAVAGFLGCSKGSNSSSGSSAPTPPNSALSFVVDYTGNIFACAISATNGSFSGCAAVNNGTTFTHPEGFSIAATDSPAVYVTDQPAGNVYVCAVNTSTMQFSSCSVSNGGASGWKPMDIQIIPGTSQTLVYVVDNRSGTGNIWLCTADPNTAVLSGCATSNGGVSWNSPNRISFGVANGAPMAYVTDPGTHNVYACGVNVNNGELTTCSVSNGGESTWDPSGVYLAAYSANAIFAYVSDPTNGNVMVCNVNVTSGQLSGCTVSNGGASGWAPSALTISYDNGLYTADVADQHGNLYVCTVNSSTGSLSGCATSNGGASYSQPDFVWGLP